MPRSRSNSQGVAKPFLKWAGGKGQLLDQFRALYPPALAMGHIDYYIEPFVGGGAVFFELVSRFRFKKVLLNDANVELSLTYQVVKDHCSELISELRVMERAYHALGSDGRKNEYYSKRGEFNALKPTVLKLGLETAAIHPSAVHFGALLIFLNRTCFNGLYRLNAKGEFNVPMGAYKKPTICDETVLRLAERCLIESNAEIYGGDFQIPDSILDEFEPRRTFVYLDPPYRPLSATSSFTSYSSSGFDEGEQKRLAQWALHLSSSGYLIMLSNSDPTNTDPSDRFFDHLYPAPTFTVRHVSAMRMINSDSTKRSALRELLVTNY